MGPERYLVYALARAALARWRMRRPPNDVGRLRNVTSVGAMPP